MEILWIISLINRNISSNINKNILIFEDDCFICNIDLFDERWEKIKFWLDNNSDKWDIFNGGPTGVEQSKKLILLNDELKLIEIEVGKTTNFIYYNRNSIDKILKWNPDNNIAFDNFNIWNNEIKIITTFPYLTIQYSSYSDICNKEIDLYMRFKNSQKMIAKYFNFPIEKKLRK